MTKSGTGVRGQRDTGIRYGTDLRGADVDLSQEDSTLHGNEGGFKTGERRRVDRTC